MVIKPRNCAFKLPRILAKGISQTCPGTFPWKCYTILNHWGTLGASWCPVGACWGPLGASWGPLGVCWGPLGACWGPAGGHCCCWAAAAELLLLSCCRWAAVAELLLAGSCWAKGWLLGGRTFGRVNLNLIIIIRSKTQWVGEKDFKRFLKTL